LIPPDFQGCQTSVLSTYDGFLWSLILSLTPFISKEYLRKLIFYLLSDLCNCVNWSCFKFLIVVTNVSHCHQTYLSVIFVLCSDNCGYPCHSHCHQTYLSVMFVLCSDSCGHPCHSHCHQTYLSVMFVLCSDNCGHPCHSHCHQTYLSVMFVLCSDNFCMQSLIFYRSTSPPAKSDHKPEAKDEHNNRRSSSSPEPENKKKPDTSTKV